MENLENLQQVKKLSVEERIKIMEMILQSFKTEIKQPTDRIKPKEFKRFKVRQFRLGSEVHVDREELYSERG